MKLLSLPGGRLMAGLGFIPQQKTRHFSFQGFQLPVASEHYLVSTLLLLHLLASQHVSSVLFIIVISTILFNMNMTVTFLIVLMNKPYSLISIREWVISSMIVRLDNISDCAVYI
jgi:hypothetical protein